MFLAKNEAEAEVVYEFEGKVDVMKEASDYNIIL